MADKSKTAEKPAAVAANGKTPRTRSPNYPFIDLKVATGKLRALYEVMKRHPTGPEVVIKNMGYSEKSSSGKLALAALRSFGLIEDVGGLVKLSKRALDAGIDYKLGSPEATAALREAALAPGVHRKLWDRYHSDMPGDDELRRYLIRELKFNDNVVETFIEEYKATIEFSGLAEAGTEEKNEGADPRPVTIGSWVQWTNQGAMRFSEPKKVVWMSDDGEWAAVEGSETGIAVAELTVENAPESSNPPAFVPPRGTGGPPANPLFKPPAPSGPTITFPLPNDNAIEIRLKKPITRKDFERIKKLVELSEDSLVADSE